MTPEKKVKQNVMKQLKELGCYSFYPMTGGYGRSGIPDIVGCYRGMFFAIECKAGSNTPTKLQLKHIRDINDAGGCAWVANEDNMNDVTRDLEIAYRARNIRC
jgi:Holliday junction resolvase